MGLFGRTARKRFDAEAAQARLEQIRTVLPAGADVDLMEPDSEDELTYLVTVVADRARTSALLASIVEIVAAGRERWALELMVSDTDDDASAYSSIDLPDRSVEVLDVLCRAHDDLYPLVPGQTITMDAEDGAFTVGDVPRGRAVTTARAAGRWWAGLVAADVDGWHDSTLSIDVGEGEDAEITYSSTIEREPEVRRHSRNGTPRTSTGVSDAEWAERVLAAWDANLPALEAMLRLPVPAGHSVDFTFTDAKLKPRLSVTHHVTYAEDEDAAAELVAQIRSQVPDSRLKVG